MPPNYMLEMGKQSAHFFDSFVDHFGHKKYRLKSIEQYSRERNTQEQTNFITLSRNEQETKEDQMENQTENYHKLP